MSLKLDTQVQFIKGVGPKLGESLRKKGVQTVQDLLEWYPRAYEDRRAARNIASLVPDELVSLRAQFVRASSFNMGKSTRKLYDVALRDATGVIHCKFFRVPYKGYFERFQPGQMVRVIGKVSAFRGQVEFSHPDIQDDSGEDGPQDDQIIPIYPESENLTNRQIRKLVNLAIQEIKVEYADELKSGVASTKSVSAPGPKLGRSALGSRMPTAMRNKRGFEPPVQTPIEKLPQWLREKYDLVGRFDAIENLHNPPKNAGKDFIDETSKYHRRVIFEEFFWLELYLASKKSGLQRERAAAFEKKLALTEKLRQALPFQLTGAQNRAFSEILGDLAKPHPMHRLVQGDVGSGKTLVALMASLIAIENSFQAAIMVPTEILAEQHYQNAKKFLEPLGITIGLLTGSMKQSERTQTNEMIRNGLIQICVGTHALIQESVEFKNLGLVVIDEQHRFGVHQRNELKKKGMSPHFLVMTATPIPRTLAMTVYGDLDVSVIDELPPGRSPIQTRVTYENKRPQVMKFLGEQLAKGRQAYVVYPLVEESEKVDLKNAVSESERLTKEFPQYKIGLLHGKMKPAEKDDVMNRFRANEFQILVSTTVIEVGVDVPNANLMLIENAERFGLSQLHQLRGRVGRGVHKSFCVLMLGHAVSDESRERCEIMEKTTDGFKIAEADLEIRGPGEFLGARQSGLPGFKMANLVRDVKILQEARAAAFETVERDAALTREENKMLRAELVRAHGGAALISVG
jgi:ATP-dependent DNA helicase RecG